MTRPEPAFPIPSEGTSASGLSKREYFAAHALQALLTHGERGSSNVGLQAVSYADALIAALEESTPKKKQL